MTEETTNKIVDSWRGAPIVEVVEAWGVPSGKFEAGDRTVYSWTGQRGSAGVGNGLPGGVVAVAEEYSCTRNLTVNASGVVVSGQFNGNNCCFAAVAGYCASLLNPAKR